MLYYKYDENKLFTSTGIVKYSPKTGDALLPINSTLVPVPDSNGPWVWNDITQEWSLLDLDVVKNNKLHLVQIEKNKARDAGFLVNGVLFDSDSDARVAYLELATKLQADPEFTTNWKASDGVWVTMNASLFADVYSAGAAHIANCFIWQANKENEINACETIEDLNAVNIIYPN
jgi:hypothetical protein